MPTSATLGGEILPALPGVGWSLLAGVRPARRVFDMERSAAERVLQRVGPISLEMEPGGYSPGKFEALWAVASVPSSHPQRLGVLVVDRRFWWRNVHVERPYNLRRRTADRRRLRTESVPIAISIVNPDVGFKPATLFPRENPSVPWTAFGVLEDVLFAVERDTSVVHIEASLRSARQLPVQDLIVAGDGARAIAQALGFVVGANVTIDPRGHVVVFDARDGAENELLAGLGPPTAGPVLTEHVSHAATRPRKVYVLFDREIEVRFDTRVEDEAQPRSQDVRELENVLPVPDVQLTVPSAPFPVATGTWIVVDDAMSAWAADMQPGQVIEINHDNIRRTWFAPSILDALVHGLGFPSSEVLSRRLGAIRQNYRQTYRIDRRLNDRLMSLRANRIGIIDEENGTRAPARAFADWSVFYTIRSVANTDRRNRDAQMRMVDSLTSFIAYPALGGALPAPIDVSVVDEELGIIRMAFHISPFGEQASIAPGAVEGADGPRSPVADPRETRPGGPGILREFARLTSGYRAAVVVTVTPAAPTDERRFHRAEVTPAEVEGVLGRRLGRCEGPPWTIRVRPDVQTAWYMWRDDHADDVERALGLQDGIVTDEPSNAKMLKDVAVSAAAALYSSMLDRVEGTHVGGWSPSAAPQGSASGVAHELHPDGQALTTVALLPELEPIDMMAYLPESVRRRVLRLVDQRGP